MSNTTTSANMSLPIPVVGVDPGPQYAIDYNSCLTIVDRHDHTPGSGVQITTSALNINVDLSFNDNSATLLKSTRFQSQSSPLSGAADIGALYVSGVDLYYNDVSGNQVRITQNGSITGSAGSISGLSAPASASYIGGSGTFVFQSGANIPGNLDGASLTIRDQSLASFGVTISAPLALGVNYTLTLPTALPASQKFATIDNSGNVSASWAPDNSTIEVSSNNLQIKNNGVTLSKINTAVFPRSQISLEGNAGYGSTNTKIPKFNTVVINTGSDMTLVSSNSSTNGASVLINTSGTYEVRAMGGGSSGMNCGASVNSAQLTTDIQSITSANRICLTFVVAGGAAGATQTVYLTAGDIVRPHDDGNGTQPGSYTVFNIIKINN